MEGEGSLGIRRPRKETVGKTGRVQLAKAAEDLKEKAKNGTGTGQCGDRPPKSSLIQ